VAAPIAGDAGRLVAPAGDVARAAVDAALDESLFSGHVTVVGAPLDSLGDQPG